MELENKATADTYYMPSLCAMSRATAVSKTYIHCPWSTYNLEGREQSDYKCETSFKGSSFYTEGLGRRGRHLKDKKEPLQSWEEHFRQRINICKDSEA